MISIEDALSHVRAAARSFGVEEVELSQATGRFLAEAVLADRDLPPFHRAMMDGYAVCSGDFHPGPPVALELRGAVHAGSLPELPVERGSCVRILTGAPVPAGADAVVPQELTEGENGHVRFRDAIRPGANIAPRGEDARAGQELLGAGEVCTPSVVGLLASVGRGRVRVARAPRVRILVTGDELVPVASEPGPAQIRASNPYVLAAGLTVFGVVGEVHFVPDILGAVEKFIIDANDVDILIVTGGVSVGDRDFVPEALAKAGAKILFHGVDMKPGKPVLFARFPGPSSEAPVVFGLPGNPFAVQVCLRVFLEPFLRLSLGARERTSLRLRFSGERTRRGERPEFFGARLVVEDGHTVAKAVPHNGSGDVRAGVGTDGLALHPKQSVRLAAGDLVEFLPW